MITDADSDTQELKKRFEDIQDYDLRIRIDNGIIKMIPSFWNFAFIGKFFLIACSIYVFTQKAEIKIYIFFALLIAGTLFLIWLQLKDYNQIIIDTQQKRIYILPNLISKILIDQKTIPFKEVEFINWQISSDGFWRAYRRFVITITLNNNKQILSIISTKKQENANKIVTALRMITKN